MSNTSLAQTPNSWRAYWTEFISLDQDRLSAWNVELDGRESLTIRSSDSKPNSNFQDGLRRVVCHGRAPAYCRLHQVSKERLARYDTIPECVCSEPIPLLSNEIRSFKEWIDTPSYNEHGWRYWPGWTWNLDNSNNLVTWGLEQ
jgi:hypothetical protein